MEQDAAVLGPTPGEPDLLESPAALAATAPRRNSVILKGVGIVATGLVAGAMGVVTINGSRGTTNAASLRGGAGGFGQAFGPGLGAGPQPGTQGGMPLSGTISAVSPTSITVAVIGGSSATAAITAATTIIRDGAASNLASLRSGEAVLVLTSTAGGSTVARGIVVGTGATRDRFGGAAGQQQPGMTRDPQQGQPPGQGTGSATT